MPSPSPTNASIQMLCSAEDETVDEIKMYLDCRYICASEALHHIYRFPCQKKSDAIYRLSINFPDRQTVAYQPGNEKTAAQNSAKRGATLTAFFSENKYFADQEQAGKELKEIKDSRKLTYIEMTKSFTFDKTGGEWKTRKRG
uniref:Uncharacterized protein n=1 Tax=Caenorhabditis japonica TaxID=281687 RepID=A0A8R1ETQ9_CAEJA